MVRKSLLAAAMTIGLSGAANVASAQTTEINFGIISTEASANLKKIWDPFLADMDKKTGLKVNAFFASDYAGVIEGMRFKKVQVAWFGNKSAMEAVDRADGEVFAQTVDADGNPGYWSHVIVHKDSPFQKLEDVLKCDKTLDFGIGDPNSTSGFLVPTTFVFSARNIDPKNCFKTVRAANHEANALAVANKLVHVAANNNENLARLKKTAPEKAKQIRVIWTSPLIPSDPLVWRKDLDAATQGQDRRLLFAYGTKDEAEKKVLAELQWAPFRKSDNNQLLPIRQMEVNKAILKLKGDEKLSRADKTAKLARAREAVRRARQADRRAQEVAGSSLSDLDLARRRRPGPALAVPETRHRPSAARRPSGTVDLARIAVPQLPLRGPRCASMAALAHDRRPARLELGADRDVQGRQSRHRLAQHGGVRVPASCGRTSTTGDAYLKEMIETVQIAVWGTALAVLVGIPFAILRLGQRLPAAGSCSRCAG